MKHTDNKKIIILIILVGILLRLIYVIYTPITIRQHDMEENVGHLAYIETIYKTGKLPEVNTWQFYQQPLHHIVAAIFLKIITSLGVNLSVAEECLQFLTLIYSSLILIITYFILKEIEIEDILKILIITVIAVHPSLILLSGSINNDILMTMFIFLDILYLIKWYKKSSIKNTIILAIYVALGALTKISSTIIAIPIIYIFINKFFEEYFNKEKAKKEVIKEYLLKFIIFGTISLSLGLSFSIRNMVKFNQSIFYVPTPGKLTYCGDRKLLERLNIFSKEWSNVFCDVRNDCNIFAYLIKCSLFGEFKINILKNLIIERMLIIVNIVLILISLISLVNIICNKEKRTIIINMLIIFYFTEILMFLYGCFSMPYACTMDFRYIIPTIFLGMIFITQNLKFEQKKQLNSITCVIIIFTILSIIFEMTRMKFCL